MVWQTTITRADGKEAAIVTQTQLVITSWRGPFAAASEPSAASSDIVCVEAMWHLLWDEAPLCS
jgi:hypothetical protein